MIDHVLTDPFAVQRLGHGGADPVFVIDFPTYSASPRLSEMLAGRLDDRPLYQVDPLRPMLDGPVFRSLDVLAGQYAARIAGLRGASDRPTVVGYCSAGGLALRVAGLLERVTPGGVKVVLVRPAGQDRAAAFATFHEYLIGLGAADPPVPDGSRSAEDLVAWMGAHLAQQLARLAARHRLATEDEAFGELLSRYRAWLAFVLACADARPPRLSAGVDVVSIEATAPGPVIPIDPPRGYRIVRFPLLDEDDILVPELADLLVDHITGTAGVPAADR
ncbi:hypothetical protein [Catellatospora coxensis]|uniref:Thioesterase domain-containing protein n=1 Tax=Catellatospora coxensis TaxID=310354 RepID=A0A8J3P893_9ACTN|nr:hypothetical protein [Catellatospora coxensis]GIG05441.1 hypothetical protein Cco03nite_21410 [Catellatospora coxensis]